MVKNKRETGIMKRWTFDSLRTGEAALVKPEDKSDAGGTGNAAAV